MPMRQPLCPRCRNNLFVRAEQVISGRRVEHAYYCGRCELEWKVESAPPAAGERRQGERRKRRAEEVATTLAKQTAPVALRTRSERHRRA